ncbi:hypothetical protein LV84_00525 [Algoriphagus ratkowskyi]|uniref:Outer membrane protein with beta-barrel domain n=1 Tax=Algoriphagus ratkowskyi TaxID=57028 RepID=A0A2W7RH65_9BACT|nr:hypothetical protein [Algoriphagus ratkowskyi]PZX60253.1 hypothetical protein LV84_00525 [Algoriphagus ratkowskyi]TXD78074.1 hypothetical protein ESW18_08485 [Algoriphagus ratkowskyi]
MSKFLFLITPLLILSQIGHSQQREKINISIATGHNEGFNLGVRYQLNQMQVGLAFGTDFNKKKEINKPEIYTGEFFYHFAGTADLSQRKPWYLRNGIVLRKEDYNHTDLRTFNWSYNLRIGREFNISRKIGISLDGGIITRLGTKYKKTGPNPSYPDYVEHPIDPSLGLGLYYRFF